MTSASFASDNSDECQDALFSITHENSIRVFFKKNDPMYTAAHIVCKDDKDGIVKTDGKHVVVAGNGQVFAVFNFKPGSRTYKL